MFRSISVLVGLLLLVGCGSSAPVDEYGEGASAWQARYADALEQFQSGAYRDVLPVAEDLIAERPLRVEGYLLASDAARELGESILAIAFLEHALERFPRQPSVIRRLAFLYARNPERREDALNLYRLLVALNPGDPEAEALRDLVRGEPVKDAVPDGTPAIDVTPGDSLSGALASGNLEAATALLERALAEGQLSAEEWIRIGHLFVDAGDVESGLRAFTAAQEKGYHTPDLAESLGDAWRSLEAWDRAVASYQRGLLLDPDHARMKQKLERTYIRIVRAKKEGK
jgi:tetratricopeptide (TPR) repeat protein